MPKISQFTKDRSFCRCCCCFWEFVCLFVCVCVCVFCWGNFPGVLEWELRRRWRRRRRWQEMGGDLTHGSYMQLWSWQCAVWQSMHFCPKWQWARVWIPLSSVCIEISSAALFSGLTLFLQKGWVSDSLSKLFLPSFLLPVSNPWFVPLPLSLLQIFLSFLLSCLPACMLEGFWFVGRLKIESWVVIIDS